MRNGVTTSYRGENPPDLSVGRVQIAFPEDRLVVEVDGFCHHGKYLADFQRDRERQNLLTLAGWRILRFTAGDIHADVRACVALIVLALDPS